MQIKVLNKLKEKLVVLLMKLNWLFPTEKYIKMLFRLKMGHRLDLQNPKTFSEKLQWLKLYDNKPEYTTMVDKYAVKEYVAKIIGQEYVIPTLGVWDDPEDIEWDVLPDRFVLKTTHGGGSMGVVICKDKALFDKQKAVEKMKQAMKQDIYKYYKEWPYKNVHKRVFAEQYIESQPETKDIPDYKWYCFNGEPKYCQVIQNRTTNETIDFFDTNWNHQDFVGLNPKANHATITPSRPESLERQICVARSLSKDIPFVRIDLYETGAHEYFGEITFYPFSGFGKFSPNPYNEILGQMLVLPELSK